MRVRELPGHVVLVPEECLDLLRLNIKVVVVLIEDRHEDVHCIGHQDYRTHDGQYSAQH